MFCSDPAASGRRSTLRAGALGFGDDSTMQIDSTELTVVRWARLSGLPMARGGRLGISSDGTRAIFCDGSTIGIWHLDTGRVVSIAIEDFEAEELGVEADLAIAGSLLGTLCLIDPEHGRLLRFLDAGRSDARTARILDIVLDAPGRRAITASRDGCVRVWNLTSGQETMTLHGEVDNVDAVAIAPGGRFAYTVVGDTVIASDLTIRKPVPRLSLDHQITTIAVTPDGLHAAVGDESGRVHFLTLGPG